MSRIHLVIPAGYKTITSQVSPLGFVPIPAAPSLSTQPSFSPTSHPIPCPAQPHLRLPRGPHLHAGHQPGDAHVWVRVVAHLEGTVGERGSRSLAPQPHGDEVTHQGRAPVAAGSHGGRSPVELRGHEVQAGVGASPGHVPVDRRVGQAKGS